MQIFKEWLQESTTIDYRKFKPTHFYLNKFKPSNKILLCICPKCGQTGIMSPDESQVDHVMTRGSFLGRSFWNVTERCELMTQKEIVEQIQTLRSLNMMAQLGIKIKRSEYNPQHIKIALKTNQIVETDLED